MFFYYLLSKIVLKFIKKIKTMVSFANYKFLLYIVLSCLLVVLLFFLYNFWKTKIINSFFETKGLKKDLVFRSPKILKLKFWLIIVSLFLSGFVLLRPQWGEKIREIHNEGSDVLIALDVSKSMLAQDIKPNRLERAKAAIKWIAETLKGDRLGLILFAGDSFLQCPLTSDISALMMFLEVAGPSSVKLQGTDIGKMLKEAYRVFKKKSITSKILVVLTDGEDHEGVVEEGIKTFKQLDVSVYTIGLGREKGDYIPASKDTQTSEIYYRDNEGKLIRTQKNEDLLKKLAQETGGEYIDLTKNFSGIKSLIQVIEKQKKSDFGSKIIKEKKEQFQIFAFLLLFFLSLELLLPERLNSDE